jgi:hypothetical protein
VEQLEDEQVWDHVDRSGRVRELANDLANAFPSAHRKGDKNHLNLPRFGFFQESLGVAETAVEFLRELNAAFLRAVIEKAHEPEAQFRLLRDIASQFDPSSLIPTTANLRDREFCNLPSARSNARRFAGQ